MPDVDEEGYLVDPATWTEELAGEFASQENIQLTEDHWDAIRFMREYYAEHQIAPDVHHVMTHLAARLEHGLSCAVSGDRFDIPMQMRVDSRTAREYRGHSINRWRTP